LTRRANLFYYYSISAIVEGSVLPVTITGATAVGYYPNHPVGGGPRFGGTDAGVDVPLEPACKANNHNT
jgi:hypothetical protein